MSALAEIGSDIASTHEMEPVLERLAAQTRELLQVRDIAMFLLQPDGETMRAWWPWASTPKRGEGD